MISMSLCMIVKNEESRLGRCLDSVKAIVDEIVIVDTGSTDGTKDVAARYTEKCFDFAWADDFAAARNFSFSLATKDYILWLDADDVLTEDDGRKLAELKATLDASVDSVTMVYNYAMDEYGNPTLRLRRNRLVKRANRFQWHGPVHEYLGVTGNILNSNVVVTHTRTHSNSDRNLRIFENRMGRGEAFSPRDLYYYGNELMDHARYDEAATRYEQFLSTGQGWVEDSIAACGKLADIYGRAGNEERQAHFILKSFDYDVPRAEFCCRLGTLFLDKGDAKGASFWFRMATEVEPPKDSWGFIHDAYSTWIPHIQLCVCLFRMGNVSLSYHHNEIARQYRPNDESVLYNKRLLEGILNRGAVS